MLKEGKTYSLRVLKRALKDKDPKVRDQAVLGLAKAKGPKAVALLGSALKDPSTLVRARAVIILRHFPDEIEAVRLLVWVLEHDPHAFFRGKAAWSLGEMGDPSAVKYLCSALEDPIEHVAKCAAAAITKLGGPDFVGPADGMVGRPPAPALAKATATTKKPAVSKKPTPSRPPAKRGKTQG